MGQIEKNYRDQPVYLVEYDEDLWNRFDQKGQDHCFATWAKKAKPLGALYVVLRLVPDALFPSGDKTQPYIAKQVPVELDILDPILVTVKLTANIERTTWEGASDGDRILLRGKARERLGQMGVGFKNPAYEIRVPGVAVAVEQGRF